jgi:hypothetical protein
MQKNIVNVMLMIVSATSLLQGSQLSVATQSVATHVASKEAKEKCSEEQEILQAYGSIELARLIGCEVTIAAFKEDGGILALGDSKGSLHCYNCRTDCWTKQKFFATPITVLAVGKAHIAAADGTTLKIVEIGDSFLQQEFELAYPLLSLVARRGSLSFVSIDSSGAVATLSYVGQTGTYTLPEWEDIRLGIKGSAQLNAYGTACVVRDGNYAYLTTLPEKKTAARALEARAEINALGVSPDGSIVVTAVGTALTAWRASGCPYSCTLPQTPDKLVVDVSNRFIFCVKDMVETVQLYDLQKQQLFGIAAAGGTITSVLCIPSDPDCFILVSRISADKQKGGSGSGGSLVALHPTTADFKLSREQRTLLLAIAHEKKEKGDRYTEYALQEAERKLLATTGSWIKQVLARTYKVKL